MRIYALLQFSCIMWQIVASVCDVTIILWTTPGITAQGSTSGLVLHQVSPCPPFPSESVGVHLLPAVFQSGNKRFSTRILAEVERVKHGGRHILLHGSLQFVNKCGIGIEVAHESRCCTALRFEKSPLTHVAPSLESRTRRPAS